MLERVVIDPAIQNGKLVIRWTLVPVVRIIDSLASDMTKGSIMSEYDITAEDIQAALLYNAELTEKVHFFFSLN